MVGAVVTQVAAVVMVVVMVEVQETVEAKAMVEVKETAEEEVKEVVKAKVVEATEEGKVQQPSPESNDQSSSRPQAHPLCCLPST